MSNQKDHEKIKQLDRCYSAVQQSGTRGIRAVEIARKLGVHKTTVYRELSSLQLMGRVESKNGLWYEKTGKQTIKPLEREIEIELPLPKNQLQPVMALEMLAQYSEERGLPKTANQMRIMLQTLKETRTIKIKGKNVDDIDLEKLGQMIQQINKKSSNFDFKGLFKSIKNQLPSKKKTELDASNQSSTSNKHA
jgi:IS30 family transposase